MVFRILSPYKYMSKISDKNREPVLTFLLKFRSRTWDKPE